MPSVSKIENYATLQTAIADWLDRSDLGTVIPSFIQLCEADVNNKLRHFKMVRKATASISADDPVVALPDGWLEARNLEIDDTQITYQSPDVLDMYRNANPNPDDTTPLFFSFYDSNIEVWPTPTADYTIEMDYYKRISPLADEVDGTNWLLDEHPSIYLYGSLIHSAPFLRDDPRIAVWDNLYQEQLAVLQSQSKKAMSRGSRLTKAAPVAFG